MQRPSEARALILHATSSTTNTVKYCDLFESTVLPYWQSDPPRHRLTSKPYKSIWAKNSYLPEDSLTFKASHSSTLALLVHETLFPGKEELIQFESLAFGQRRFTVPVCRSCVPAAVNAWHALWERQECMGN